MLVYNRDKVDPLRAAFPDSTFLTTFMHKSMRETGVSGVLGPLAPTNFFDPRDM
jgi:hypothetical protein